MDEQPQGFEALRSRRIPAISTISSKLMRPQPFLLHNPKPRAQARSAGLAQVGAPTTAVVPGERHGSGWFGASSSCSLYVNKHGIKSVAISCQTPRHLRPFQLIIMSRTLYSEIAAGSYTFAACKVPANYHRLLFITSATPAASLRRRPRIIQEVP